MDPSFFKLIADKKEKLETPHIDAYLALLHTSPEFAGFKKCDAKVTITCTSILVINKKLCYIYFFHLTKNKMHH